MNSKVTVIHGSWVYAVVDNVPTVLPDHDVVITDDKIVEVVPKYNGRADKEIDATGKLVLPGFINLHTHCNPMQRGTTVDLSVVNKVNNPLDTVFLYSLFYPLGFTTAGKLTKEETKALMKVGLLGLIRGGSTTIVEMGRGIGTDLFADIAIEVGARTYIGRSFESLERMPHLKNNEFIYPAEAKDPLAGLEANIKFHERYNGSGQGRVNIMLAPHCTDTVSLEVLLATREAADKLGCGIMIHLAQAKAEVQRIKTVYNQSPTEYLNEAGLLGPDLLAAHGLYTDEKDRVLLKEKNVNIVHCTTSFAKGGVALPLEHFVQAGINVGIGTDSFHTDLLVELRTVALLAKVIEENPWVASAHDLLSYATVKGAKALNRPDLGKISPGAKADLIIVNLNRIHNAPVLDPLRKAVYLSNLGDIDTVLIDGQVIIENGSFINVDEAEAVEEAKPAFAKIWEIAGESGLIKL